jgi:CubicO group peptidase (beta-lactamase class C family)
LKRWIFALAVLGILALAGARAWELLNAVAGSNAKVLCSAVFVSGRELEEARAHSIRIDPPASRVHVDRDEGIVRVSIGGLLRRKAVFAGDQGCVALPRGRLVAERYAPGIEPGTQLESWSMGKSVTATLVGLLIQEGALRLEQPAPVDE